MHLQTQTKAPNELSSQWKQEKPDWQWLAISWSVIAVMASLLSKALLAQVATINTPIFENGIKGLIIGILQWLILRRYFKNAGGWILLTFLGFTGSAAASVLFWDGLMQGCACRAVAYNYYITAPVIGLIKGGCQWVMLRRWFPWASMWLVVSAVIQVVSYMVWLGTHEDLLSAVVSGLLAGAVLGYLLERNWMIRRSD
jgi:hypothetical protein